MVDYGPQAPINTTSHTIECIWACRTRTVYGRQRCRVVLCSSSVVYLVYVCLGCVPMGSYRGGKLTTTERLFVMKPGKSPYTLRPNIRTLRACHALQRARIAPGPQPMCPPGLLVLGSLTLAFHPKRARTKRKSWKKSTKTKTPRTYT